MGRTKAERADEFTRDELLTEEERAAEAAEAEKYEQQAATPKKNAKASKATPKEVPCAGCGQSTGGDGRYCWDCRDLAKDLSVRLVVESFAQGHEVKAGVALAFDWTDEALAERGRRVRADADLRGDA